MRASRLLPALLAMTLAVGVAAVPATASAADPGTPVGQDALWFTTSPSSFGVNDFWRSSVDGTDDDLLVSGLGNAVPSPNGSKLAWTARDTHLDRQTVVVGDLRGRNQLTVARTSPGEFVSRIEWSPASDAVLVSTDVYASQPPGGAPQPHVTVVPLSLAEPLTVVPRTENVTNAAYVPGDPTRLVGMESVGDLSVVVLRIGEEPTVLPGTSRAWSGLVLPSPDGTHVAYEARVTEGGVERDELRLVALDGSGSTVLLRDATRFKPSAWSRDGAYLYGSLSTPTGHGLESLDIARLAVTSAGSVAAPVVLRHTPAVSERGIRLAPGPVSGSPGVRGLTATLNGSHPTLAWRLPDGATRVDVYRAAGATPTQRGTLVQSGLATSFTDTVPVGTTSTWTVVAIDGSGEREAVRTRAVGVGTPPVRMPFSAALTSASPLFDVQWWAAGDLGNTSYDVQWASRNVTGTLSPWRTWFDAGGGGGATFGDRGVPTKPLPGTTYAIRARSVDRYGNVSAWSVPAQTSVPLDQASARFSRRWLRVVGKDRWLGAAASTTVAGQTATLQVAASRLQVIGERCPRCGRLSVTLDGRRMAMVDSRASKRLVRQALWTSGALARGRVHTLVVTSVATAGRPDVVLDAFTVVR